MPNMSTVSRKDGGDTPLRHQPWDQQPKESNPAFAAFRCYVEMGEKRSVRKVADQLDKSRTMVGRWSKRWKWPERVRNYTKSIVDKVDEQVQEKAIEVGLPDIMCQAEVLARVSILARTDPLMLLNEQGELDIAEVKRRGLGFLLSAVETTATNHPNGKVTFRTRLKIEGGGKFLELMGKHHGLWTDEFKDPQEELARYFGIPKHQLPPTLDELLRQVAGGRYGHKFD